MKIKENKGLHKKCVYLKQKFVDKVLRGNGLVKSTCFCGVTEYVMPIKYKERLICMVSATGFCGKLRDNMYRALCEKVDLTYDQFMTLRERALSKVENEQSVINSIKILSHLLSRYIFEESKTLSLIDSTDCESNEHLLKAKKYISQNFSSPIQTSCVAKYCHLSKSHLEHIFCDVIGHGIAEEIRICRLNYAKELLCTTDYSVKYIAFVSGFSSSDYFATVFKKVLQDISSSV